MKPLRLQRLTVFSMRRGAGYLGIMESGQKSLVASEASKLFGGAGRVEGLPKVNPSQRVLNRSSRRRPKISPLAGRARDSRAPYSRYRAKRGGSRQGLLASDFRRC